MILQIPSHTFCISPNISNQSEWMEKLEFRIGTFNFANECVEQHNSQRFQRFDYCSHLLII